MKKLTARISANILKCPMSQHYTTHSRVICLQQKCSVDNSEFPGRASHMKQSSSWKSCANKTAERTPEENHLLFVRPDSAFEQLLSSAKQGSINAIGELLIDLRSYLKIVAETALVERSVARSYASDMVQIAHFEAVRQIPCFRGTTQIQFRAWVRQILLNKIVDAQRAAIRESLPLEKLDPSVWGTMLRSIPEAIADDPSPSSLCMRNERELILHSMLRTLSPRYQEVIKRRHFESESFEEIAAAWNCSADSVRKVWTRAIGKLRDKLRPIP
ncbi:MAG: sigma-70 family RNA polymerase sigma factor [Planctomycetaceae bacterium]|nr:sigma-70 family RNA polymerase sigma factor [Planctomycetaceae bacterium]